jgi:hypothetical protein
MVIELLVGVASAFGLRSRKTLRVFQRFGKYYTSYISSSFLLFRHLLQIKPSGLFQFRIVP